MIFLNKKNTVNFVGSLTRARLYHTRFNRYQGRISAYVVYMNMQDGPIRRRDRWLNIMAR